MTTINATINGVSEWGGAAKRIDIWHESGGIGNWEILFDNDSGGSQLLTPNLVASNLGVNGVNLMQGYVDDILPDVKDPAAVFSKYGRVVGRNYGRDLACKFIIKDYAGTTLDDLVEDALSEAGSEITFTSPSTAPVVDAKFNKTYLQNGFAEAFQQTDYDFYVDNSKAFHMHALGDAPDSGVLLKAVAGDPANNILLIDPMTRAGKDIYNYIRVDAGTLNDHWTEGNAEDWEGVDCTVTDDNALSIIGASSIQATLTTNDPGVTYLPFPNYNYTYLDFTEIDAQECSCWVAHNGGGTAMHNFQVYLKDTAGNEIVCFFCDDVSPATFKKGTFYLGVNAPFDTGETFGKWFYLSGSNFNWQIARIGVRFYILNQSGVKFWIDGLKIDGVDVWAYAEDAASIAAYGTRMIPLTRTDVKSQLQLQEIADTELANRKDPIEKLNLTCTLQTALLYAGYLVSVLAPNTYIGSGETPEVYRILTLHHAAEPGVDLCRGHDAVTELELIKHDGGAGADPTRFKLASSPQAAINVRYDSRLRVLESSLTGSGSLLGGAGGGAGVDWDDVPYIRVKGISYFEDMAHHEHEFPQLDYDAGEVYTWMYSTDFNDFTDFAEGSNVRFKDTTEGAGAYACDIYGVLLMDGETPVAPAVAISHHLLVRKDFFIRGMVSTYEGCLALQGGSDYRGWGPDGPIIWLSRGGDLGSYNTLQIARMVSSAWTVGHLKVGDVLPGANAEYDLGKVDNAWNHLFSAYGSIGQLTVTASLSVDSIYGYTDTELTIDPYGSNRTKIVGDLHVTGNVTGDGTFPAWNGGTITGNITIQKATPTLTLDATSGNPEIIMEDAKLYRSDSGGSHFVMEKPLIVEDALWCNEFGMDNCSITEAGILSVSGISTTENKETRLFLGRYSSGAPYSFIAPSANSSGIKFNNAALNKEMVVIDDYGIHPPTSNVYHSGLDSAYWNCVWANYLKYHTSCTAFDSLDDLALIKNYKVKKMLKDGVETDVIDEDSLGFLRDVKGFHSMDRDVGFLLGCVKQLVHRVETLEKQVKEAKAA